MKRALSAASVPRAGAADEEPEAFDAPFDFALVLGPVANLLQSQAKKVLQLTETRIKEFGSIDTSTSDIRRRFLDFSRFNGW
jgi:hypothetical protein